MHGKQLWKNEIKMKKTGLKMAAILTMSMICLAPMIAILPARTQAPFFSVTLGAPDNNPARIAWAGIISDSYRRLNIDSNPFFASWGVWIPRVFSPTPDIIGQTYDNGGYDIFFVGWSMGVNPDPTNLYHSGAYVPTGYNYPLWNNSVNDQLITDINAETNVTARNILIFEWQQNFQEESPKAIILYPQSAWAFTPTMRNFATFSYTFPQCGRSWSSS
jgi:hypothetical protein